MRRSSLLKSLRRRSFLPVLLMGYVLLFQAILGTTATSAHAFAMAQQEALGLAMLCVEDGTEGRRLAGADDQESEAPAGDCINCKIACAIGIAMPVLPTPDLAPLFIVSRQEAHRHALVPDLILPRSALFKSDLPARAPPAAI
jgi:hypothetical protein